MAYHQNFQYLLIAALIFFPLCSSKDTITPIQSVRDGETLVSAGKNFALGFFSPENSKNRYIGIWFNNIPNKTVVWVANRENPVRDSSGILTINAGNLELVGDGGSNSSTTSILWSTNVSNLVPKLSNATLMDSGNLILRDDHHNILWQSFDHPTNTLLPNMKLGLDRKTGLNRFLTSWRSIEDPAPGEFSFGLDPHGMPQFSVRKGSDPIWRETWNGQRLISMQVRNLIIEYTYVYNDDEIYYMYTINDGSIMTMAMLDVSGVLQRLKWTSEKPQWDVIWVSPQDRCDRYANCGAYGYCDSNHVAECGCIKGFEPKMARDWNSRNWSDGCVRHKPLDCAGQGDGFFKFEPVKLPDTSRSRVEPTWSLIECKDECLKNCSCTAYATANVSGEGGGCVLWYGNLTDVKVYSDQGQDLYIRVAASELDENLNRYSGGSQGKKKLLVTLLTLISVALLSCFCGYCWWKKAKGYKMNERSGAVFNNNGIEENGKGSELSLFSFSVIVAITNNFSESNMLGKGGFGPVYKGQLLNGQEMAVKRLSKSSGQGIEEFKNEVTLIAKLQHKNLVKLLGCCISGQEKILIYEYMRNKSLDSLIFDQTRSIMLDWRKRFSIIIGIARGILYLHEDSRLRIIHRDLKVSNILLDDEMNPKISDFGMARIFGGNQTQANTNRVVGTYGYMSPEYAMHGLFSIKSDVFSFGVILLEIINGKRNNYYNECRSMNLLGHVWELWKEDRILELVDSLMNISTSESEVLRCIQVGLLCVQEKAEDRPNMSSVIFMLCNERAIPSPKQPAFCFWKGNYLDRPHLSTNGISGSSKNEVTITEIEAR